MKLIDANVLMYTVGGEHPYKRPSIAVLAKQQLGEIEANINAEALQEILHFYHGRKRIVEGFRLFDDVVVKFPSPFPILTSTVRMARQVLGNNPRLQSRDAIHAAVVFEQRLEGIISADRAFDGIAGLRRFDPKELAV